MNKFKMLIVDDEIINIDILKNIFANDYEIFVAKDGEKAIKIINKTIPDIVLLDVSMPNMNGLELLAAIKKFPHLKKTPVIFVTSESDNETRQKGMELGAVDYIYKPFKVEEIIGSVESHLKKVFRNRV